MSRRATGAGTIEHYRDGFRARLPDAKRTPLGIYDTEADAERALDAWFAASSAPRGDSLASYGPRWLDRRERSGRRGIAQDRARWRAYVEPWECYQWPLREIRRGDVRRLVDGLAARGLADQTIRNTLNLLRVCLRDALDDELVAANPAVGVRVHPRGKVEDAWDYLRPAEQTALLSCADIPGHLRALIAFAIGTGLRWGEQRTLARADVHTEGDAPFVRVRRSGKGTTKSTKHRSVPLFGLGLAAAKALVADADERRNPRGLLCLPPKGTAYIGANGPRLEKWLAAAHVERSLRWHDLRHTCGSSLIAGWWGRAWTLVEVRDFLGHSSVTVTERYAHLAGSVVESAARATRGAISAPAPDRVSAGATSGIWTPDLRFTKPRRTARDSAAVGARGGAVMAPKGLGLPRGVKRLPAGVQEYIAERLGEASLHAVPGGRFRTLLPLAKAARAIDTGRTSMRRARGSR